MENDDDFKELNKEFEQKKKMDPSEFDAKVED